MISGTPCLGDVEADAHHHQRLALGVALIDPAPAGNPAARLHPELGDIIHAVIEGRLNSGTHSIQVVFVNGGEEVVGSDLLHRIEPIHPTHDVVARDGAGGHVPDPASHLTRLQRQGVPPFLPDELGGGAGTDAGFVLEFEERACNAGEIGKLVEPVLVDSWPRTVVEDAQGADALAVYRDRRTRIEAEGLERGEAIVRQRVRNKHWRGFGDGVRGKTQGT